MFEFLKRNKDDYIRLARIALGTSNKLSDLDALDRIKRFKMLGYDIETNYNPDNYIKL